MKKHWNHLLLFTLLGAAVGLHAAARTTVEPNQSTKPMTELGANSSLAEKGSVQKIRVRCGGNKTIGKGLQRANRNRELILEFSGTCHERVVIARNDVTLRGVGKSPTIVGNVSVLGGQRVRLEEFLVRDTQGAPDPFFPDGDGISVLASTAVTIRGLTVQDTERRGISIEGSTATIIDSSVIRAQGIGIIALSAFVNIEGTVSANDGLATSVCAAMSGHIFVRPDATLIANNNAIGILSEVNGVITLAVRSRVEANGNEFIGFGSVTGGTVVFSDTDIQINDNLGLGLIVSELSSWGPFTDSTVVLDISNNSFAGVVTDRSSMANFEHGTTIGGNGGPGLMVEDSRVAVQGTTSAGNGGNDVMFTFNGRGTLGPDNHFGSPIFCDESALLQGEGSCAPPESAKAATRTLWKQVELLRSKIAEFTPLTTRHLGYMGLPTAASEHR